MMDRTGTTPSENGALLQSAADLYRTLWRHSRGRRSQLFAAAALLSCAELMRLALPWLAGSAIDILQRGGMTGLSPAARYLAMLFGIVVFAWAGHGTARVLERNVAQHARRAFTLELMDRLLCAPLSWHRREHPVAVSQRAMQGSQALHDFAESQYIYLQSVVQIGGPLVALWMISPWVGAVATTGMALLGAVTLGFDRELLRLTEVKNEADRSNASAWADVLGNFLTVQALRMRTGIMAMTGERLHAIFKPLRRLVLVNELKWSAVDILGNLLWCVLVALYVAQTALHAQDAGDVVALGGVFMVYEYARRAERSMSALAQDAAVLAGQLAGFRAVRPLLSAPACENAPATLETSAWHSLELCSVSLAFDGVELALLRGVNLRLRRGRRYALVGASGAGKTSLLMLLAGLDGATSGQVLRDGFSIDSAALRREAVLIPCQPARFRGSVLENVSPELPRNRKRALDALSAVDLADFIQGLPQQEDTIIGEDAAHWSAGQQQRLCLARGTLAAQGASLLLLDEPTSHLDRDGARLVLSGLLERHAGACVVCALHDLELLGSFDEVIVMDRGRVVDAGPTAEVSARCGFPHRFMNNPTREHVHA